MKSEDQKKIHEQLIIYTKILSKYEHVPFQQRQRGSHQVRTAGDTQV